MKSILSANIDSLWDKKYVFTMAEGINVRLSGRLQDFVKEQSHSETGLFQSSSEYIRDLIRRDYEKSEKEKRDWLRSELEAGAQAPESEFQPVSASDFLAEMHSKK